LPGTEEGLHNHTYQDKEFQFAEFSDGRGLELHDFHARMYDATTGRWLVPDPAAQFANPYLAMGNNPVSKVDPDGRFSVVTSWLTGFVHGFFSTGSGRRNEGWQNANHSAGNNLKIKRGLFVLDKNKTFGGQVWELVSRFTWQLPQTIGGYYTAQTYNLFQKVNWVEHEHGATVVNADRMLRSQDENWGGVAQGSFIVGDPRIEANAHNHLFQHEYGHYLQSQEMGWGYYNRVGIPSIMSGGRYGDDENGIGRHDFHPVEQDANRRAFLYFNNEVDGFKNDQFIGDSKGWNFVVNPLDVERTFSRRTYIDFDNLDSRKRLQSLVVRTKWYDYLWIVSPYGWGTGFYNAYQYNHED
jgi:RHS repeat-associated protein